MHRVRAPEFKHIIVVSANSHLIPLHTALQTDDPIAQEAALNAERCLHVGVRAEGEAKQTATITSYGTISEWLAELDELRL